MDADLSLVMPGKTPFVVHVLGVIKKTNEVLLLANKPQDNDNEYAKGKKVSGADFVKMLESDYKFVAESAAELRLWAPARCSGTPPREARELISWTPRGGA